MNKERYSVMKLKGDDTWKFLMHSLPKRMQGHISSVTLLGELRRKSRLGITFVSCPLIFSRCFLFSAARKFCTGSTSWTSKWGPVSSRSTYWGWKQICAPSEFMGSRGFGLPGRKSWEMEGKSLSCRHKGPWQELAVSKAYIAVAGGVLSKWTKCWTVLSHTEVSHGSKDPSDCYGKERPPSQPIQSFKTWKGDEHEMNVSFFISLSEYKE